MSGYNPYGPNSYGYFSQGFATSSYNPQQMQCHGIPNNGTNAITGNGLFYGTAGPIQTDPTFGHSQSAFPGQMPVYMDAQAVSMPVPLPVPVPMPVPMPTVLHPLSENHQERRAVLAKLEKVEKKIYDLEQKKQKLLVNDQEIEAKLIHQHKLISIQWEKMSKLTFGHGQTQMQFEATQNQPSCSTTASLETPTHMDYETSADSAYSSKANSNVPPSVEQQEEGQQLHEMAQLQQPGMAQHEQLEMVQLHQYAQEQQFMSQQQVQPVRQQQLQEQQQFMAQQAQHAQLQQLQEQQFIGQQVQHVQHVQQQQLQQQMEGLAQAQQPEILHFRLTTLAEIEEYLKIWKDKRDKWQDKHRLYTVGPAEAKERHFKELSTVMPSFDERLMEVGEAILWHINKKCGHQICNYIYTSIEQHDEKASSLFNHFFQLLPVIKHQPLFQIVSYDVKKQSKYLLNLEIELLCKDLLANCGFQLEAECWLIDEKNGHKFEQFCIIDEAFQAHGKEEKAELLCKNPLARLKMDVSNYTAVKKDLHIFKRNNNNRKLHENAYKIEFLLKLRTPYLAMNVVDIELRSQEFDILLNTPDEEMTRKAMEKHLFENKRETDPNSMMIALEMLFQSKLKEYATSPEKPLHYEYIPLSPYARHFLLKRLTNGENNERNTILVEHLFERSFKMKEDGDQVKFTLLEWIYGVARILTASESVYEMWKKRLLFGFISREEADIHVKCCNDYSAILVRFSNFEYERDKASAKLTLDVCNDINNVIHPTKGMDAFDNGEHFEMICGTIKQLAMKRRVIGTGYPGSKIRIVRWAVEKLQVRFHFEDQAVFDIDKKQTINGYGSKKSLASKLYNGVKKRRINNKPKTTCKENSAGISTPVQPCESSSSALENVTTQHECTVRGPGEKPYCRLMYKEQHYNPGEEQLAIPNAKVVFYHGQHYIVEASEFQQGIGNVDEPVEVALHFFK